MSVIRIAKGRYQVVRLTVLDADLVAAGEEITEADLTGRTLRLQVRTTPDAEDALITKATGGGGITILDQEDNLGQAKVAFEADDTADLEVGTYWWDVIEIDGSSRPISLMPQNDRFVVWQGVTVPP